MRDTIFKNQTEMPSRYEAVSSALVRQDTDDNPGPRTPLMSGEVKWPGRDVSNLRRPRRGHGY